MLPGDYIALQMTGEVRTTPSGLSEGILWDFQEQDLPAGCLLEHYGIPEELLPPRSCRPSPSRAGSAARPPRRWA